jgi:glycine cleavage system regulatory protein
MLVELDKIVKRYYEWTKITETCMTEMHGRKRHGYGLDVDDNNMYEAVTCLVLDHHMKLKRITSPYSSYMVDGENVFSIMITVDTNWHLINTYN